MGSANVGSFNSFNRVKVLLYKDITNYYIVITVLVQWNGEASEAKEQIIGILAEQFPLTAKRLYNLMKKRYMSGTTYHAVYKQLRELVKKGVVVKNGTQYRLSEEWMVNTRRFLSTVENNYAAEKLNGASVDCVRLLSFKSQTDFYNFIESMRNNFIRENKSKEILWVVNHAWGPLFFMNSAAESIKEAKKNGIKFYMCIRGGSMLDKVVADFYKSMNIKHVTYNIGSKNNYSIYIYGNELILVDHPQDVSEQIDVVFKRTKKMSDINLGRLYQCVMQKEQPVQAIIVKNRRFVERYKNTIKSYFPN